MLAQEDASEMHRLSHGIYILRYGAVPEAGEISTSKRNLVDLPVGTDLSSH